MYRRWVVRPLYWSYFVLCCIGLLLSGCASSPQSSGSSGQSRTPVVTQMVTPRSDAYTSRTEELRRKQLAKVQQIFQQMTLEEKLGQLIIVEYIGNNYTESGLKEMIVEQHVGGYMYQSVNHNFDAPYDTISSVKSFSDQASKDAKIPLLIATDQEGGQVNRLYNFHGELPSAQEMAATGDPNAVLQRGTQFAKWMVELGINSDLAPVADVHTVDPPVLQDRMFGRDPKTVATYAGAFLDGLQKNGVAGCVKHFPGLGAISADPHYGLPTVNRSMEELRKIDLAAFQLLIQKNNPAMIMSTDVLMPAIDPQLPAELSPKAIDGVLRKELGYDGVVITDGLYMQGISERWSLGEASVLSIVAGNDLIEGPFTNRQVADVLVAFKQALSNNKLTMERVDQAVKRVLLMKVEYGMIQ